MNRGGSIVLTGSFVNVGTSYTAVTLTGAPRKGYITRSKVTKTGGSGTGARMKMVEPGTSRALFEYDDPDTPGDPIDFDGNSAVDVADTEIYYDKGTGDLQLQVATDNATTDGNVEVIVRKA